jgi:hypothetical protein
MRYFTTLFIVGLLAFTSYSQTKAFFLGHSLINFEIPNMVNRLAEASTKNYTYKANIGNGANLSWHYTNPHTGQGDRWDMTLPQGGFTHFIMTEAVPLAGHLMWSDTYKYADLLADAAKDKNPSVRTYIYETWHCINSGTPQGCEWEQGDDDMPWRDRLSHDLSKWEGILNHLKSQGHDAYLIPGGQGLSLLHDEIIAGKLLGYSDSRALFTDDIHLSLVGNYFIACIMYSSIFGVSAEGLPHRLHNNWQTLYNVYPTPDQAAVLQRVAWETVCKYAHDGVQCITDTHDEMLSRHSLYYDPSEQSISTLIPSALRVVDINGNILATCKDCTSLSFAPPYIGLYFATAVRDGKLETIRFLTH